MCKFLEFLDQHPQRNNLSKLATFDPILQRPHSALDDKDKNEVEDEKKGDEDAINENWNDCVKIFSFSWG